MSSMLTQVLCVVEDFDGFGGASEELVAWELGIEHDDVRPVWGQAIDQALLIVAPRDRIFDEAMFRLSPRGRARLADSSRRSQPASELRLSRAPEPVGRLLAPELAPSLAD
jgi:hypothetical protein